MQAEDVRRRLHMQLLERHLGFPLRAQRRRVRVESLSERGHVHGSHRSLFVCLSDGIQRHAMRTRRQGVRVESVSERRSVHRRNWRLFMHLLAGLFRTSLQCQGGAVRDLFERRQVSQRRFELVRLCHRLRRRHMSKSRRLLQSAAVPE